MGVGAERKQGLRGGRVAAGLLAAGLLLASCSGRPQFTYVKSSEGNAFLRLPSSWTLFEQSELGASAGPASSPTGDTVLWQVAFDAGPKPSIEHVLDDPADHPAGFATVRKLTPLQRDSVSLVSLRNLVVQVDSIVEREGEDALEYRRNDVLVEGSLHGARNVFTVKLQDGFVTFDQTAL
ncbi:MAG: hypothetical protein M3198_07615, partial [Actinomycetota bacterium]|nr:hypothetical protein [Actinomycetota bacterium]